METKAIWLNGKLVPKADATLNFLTPALHYGVAVFEGIRCYATAQGPCVFRLRDHIDRLFDSARVLGFRELPYSADQIVEACLETVRANGFTECYVRPLIWLAWRTHRLLVPVRRRRSQTELKLRRRPDGKLHLLRVVAARGDDGRWRVRPVAGQGSHQLWAAAGANALALVPDGAGVEAGGSVRILLIDLC